jgi:hypothetical protein
MSKNREEESLEEKIKSTFLRERSDIIEFLYEDFASKGKELNKDFLYKIELFDLSQTDFSIPIQSFAYCGTIISKKIGGKIYKELFDFDLHSPIPVNKILYHPSNVKRYLEKITKGKNLAYDATIPYIKISLVEEFSHAALASVYPQLCVGLINFLGVSTSEELKDLLAKQTLVESIGKWHMRRYVEKRGKKEEKEFEKLYERCLDEKILLNPYLPQFQLKFLLKLFQTECSIPIDNFTEEFESKFKNEEKKEVFRRVLLYSFAENVTFLERLISQSKDQQKKICELGIKKPELAIKRLKKLLEFEVRSFSL